MSEAWTDRITGARMQVDRQFQQRVRDSQFTNQQWGLIMTAVEFRIDNPETPEEATLVADTTSVEGIMPDIENLPSGMGAGPQPRTDREEQDGLLGRLRGLLSGGSEEGVDEERLAAMNELVDAYARELQEFLEEKGRWAEVCESAARA